MKDLIKILLSLIFMMLCNGVAYAAGTYDGQISEVWVNDGTRENVGYIKLPADMVAGVCTSKNWFLLDLTKADMKLAITLALTAHASGKQVKLGGTGTCDGNYELLKYIAVK